MRKITAVIMIVVGMAALLCGCASTKLSASFNKDDVEASAKQVIKYLNDKDYDSVTKMFQKDLQKQLSADNLEAAVNKTYGEAGAFKEFKNIAILGQKVKSTGEDAALVIVVAKYEKQKVTFTISFNTDMKLIGLYMK